MKLDICLVVCDVFALEVLSIQQVRELSVGRTILAWNQQSVLNKSWYRTHFFHVNMNSMNPSNFNLANFCFVLICWTWIKNMRHCGFFKRSSINCWICGQRMDSEHSSLQRAHWEAQLAKKDRIAAWDGEFEWHWGNMIHDIRTLLKRQQTAKGMHFHGTSGGPTPSRCFNFFYPHSRVRTQTHYQVQAPRDFHQSEMSPVAKTFGAFSPMFA